MKTPEEINDIRKALIILQKARKLIVNKGWTQYFYARDSNGKQVTLGSEKATCYCAMGAMYVAIGPRVFPYEEFGHTDENGHNLAWSALRAEIPKGYMSIPKFNDSPLTTAKDIEKMFDRAIYRLGVELQEGDML